MRIDAVHPTPLIDLIFLLAVANGAPVIAKRLLGRRFACPLDGGAMFIDGRPLFGPAKTIRGILSSLLATPVAAALIGLQWNVGFVVAAGAMTGDLLSSFVKRRMGLPPSSRAIGLDQIPESLLPMLACRLLLPVTAVDIVIAVSVFLVGEIVLSRILFMAHIRDQPY
jgi:hypothetical protein